MEMMNERKIAVKFVSSFPQSDIDNSFARDSRLERVNGADVLVIAKRS